MRYNVGSIERIVRVVVGLGVLSLAFVGPASPWGYLGLVLVVTGLAGWCPMFAMFSTTTCNRTGSCPHGA